MAETRTALVVEDDGDIRHLISSALRQGGFSIEEAGSGREGLDRARLIRPDLITLDVTLPDMDGIEVCREIRAFSDAYVVIVTAKGEEVDRLIGLEVGADDYVVKPFSPRELRARVAAMFRRPRTRSNEPSPFATQVIEVGPLSVDQDAREARLGNELLPLTRTEFDLLATLAGNPGRVFERDTLYRIVWSSEWIGDPHLVDVHVSNLRRKLDGAGVSEVGISTVRGVGYRFTVAS